jgi:hypothetical protein
MIRNVNYNLYKKLQFENYSSSFKFYLHFFFGDLKKNNNNKNDTTSKQN